MRVLAVIPARGGSKSIPRKNLVEAAATKGRMVLQTIRDAAVGCVKDVRGAGFMVGIELDKPAAHFLADIGLDRNVDNSPASTAFHVQVDGKDVFTSKVFKPNGEVQSIDVPLDGATTFDLMLDVGGDDRTCDQGDWCDAHVIMQDGTQIWLDDLVPNGVDTGRLPFSFVYGGRSSRDFLAGWPMTVEEKPLDDRATQRTLTFTDPETKLEVRAVAKIYQDVPGVDWTLYFTNHKTRNLP